MNLDEHTQRRVEAALLDRDGSCRDINFAECISTSGAIGVLEFLASSWTLAQATTGDGEEIAGSKLESTLPRDAGSLSTIWHGGRNPEHIQAYFFWDAPDKVFCEITFFPEDLERGTFKLTDFLEMLGKLAFAAQTDEYYLRYEDASWRHGQQEKAGVILSDQVFPLSVG